MFVSVTFSKIREFLINQIIYNMPVLLKDFKTNQCFSKWYQRFIGWFCSGLLLEIQFVKRGEDDVPVYSIVIILKPTVLAQLCVS
jgi:hypothetical protein